MRHPKYPNLFTPLQLGPITVPTRFYFAPHGSALTVGSKPADDLIAYSAARVEGGGCGRACGSAFPPLQMQEVVGCLHCGIGMDENERRKETRIKKL